MSTLSWPRSDCPAPTYYNTLWALEAKGLAPVHKLVLVELARISDSHGGVSPAALPQLSEQLGADGSLIDEALAALEVDGFLERREDLLLLAIVDPFEYQDAWIDLERLGAL
jgi:hypothetical protein